ncbi:DMT(drug/metabolite transporter) superfamily permease [Corynebacterium mustelae]|uniref:DMT(Drug/metabolite transporter) superfamily permease n=1 Tax=Corynebacterium mustelae TaxID=571915 RepID=A0A0G3GXI7_9CORY|nr:DMT family transporter [Corynebacterium mustelae]AKK05881.1 DMT(drug/metabolite transporter) superfamily permease [Corynebacterium mustelae]
MKSYASSSTKTKATLCAVLAAAFYAVSVPMSKLFIADVRPAMLAAFLYLGAGVGMTLSVFVPWMFIRSSRQSSRVEVTTGTGHSSWEKQDLPFVLAMIALDIAAPILLMFGVSLTTSATVSLLNNFEIVATSVIAFVAFKEEVSRRLWLAIASVTVSSIILSVESDANFSLNYGAIFVLAACVCWGVENNCTTRLSSKSPQQLVIIKGMFSGLGCFVVAKILAEEVPNIGIVAGAMFVGFVGYGLSITFYIFAQRNLGAAKTSAYYAIAPFLGVAFSMIILGEIPNSQFWLALLIMVCATYLMVKDSIELQHSHLHSHTHTHFHSHGDVYHCHEHAHSHLHAHTHNSDSSEAVHDHDHDFLSVVHDHSDHSH